MAHLDITTNDFVGRIPTELGLLTKLTFLGGNNNEFTGALPTELGALTIVENLYARRASLRPRVDMRVSRCVPA
jgi:hypothetical protein